MEITLEKIRIENFKGIRSREIEFGKKTELQGENGSGKTSAYDAYLWCLEGKDSEGSADFGVRPIDDSGEPIKGVIVLVELKLRTGSATHVIRKEQHEKVIKGQLKGYETVCFVDDVPKKVGEFKDFVEGLYGGETVKLLTDVTYFPIQLHWQERRDILLDLAGEVAEPEGFEALMKKLNNRSMEDYRKVLDDQKKGYKKERDQINPRIDEKQKGLNHEANKDTKDIIAERDELKGKIDALTEERRKLLGGESERQAKISKLNELKSKKALRVSELANDTTGVQNLIDARQTINDKFAKMALEHSEWVDKVEEVEERISKLKDQLSNKMDSRQGVFDEYQSIQNQELDTKCYTCNQELPKDKAAEILGKKEKRLSDIRDSGNAIKIKIDILKGQIEEAENELAKLKESDIETKHKEGKEWKDKKLAEIADQINNREKIDPESDPIYKGICLDIKHQEEQIGESDVAKLLESFESQRDLKQERVDELNSILSDKDNYDKAIIRIKELHTREKELGQLMADIEKEINSIGEYTSKKNIKIQQSVNQKFKHVKFRLFKQNLNGSIEGCCDPLYNDVKFSDISTGEKIMVGMDIINTLVKHFDKHIPLFIDHVESVTLPLEANTQIIGLRAVEGIQEFKVI